MRLSESAVAEIKASRGVYRASDVAREYEVHPSTVTRIWAGELRKAVRRASEPPNIHTRPRPSELVKDMAFLKARGMSYQEVADALGVNVKSVYYYLGGLLT